MKDLKSILENRIVDMYDSNGQTADMVNDAGARRVTLYARSKETPQGAHVVTRPYRILTEAADCIANVCMLDGRAIKILVAMYPSAPKYVLVRLAPRLAWFLGFVGLLRRWVTGLVRIEGVAVLRGARGRSAYWLVIEQSGGAVHRIPVLPKQVGVPTFLDWLRKEHITYVVLRFYEKLPELHRAAGDLDLLVSDADRSKVEAYLASLEDRATDLSDDIRVGLHSVSGEPGMIPYYPPPLARHMLERAVDGPAGSRIPEPPDALRSFIYHVLYHSKKGYASGIPSSLSTYTDARPENDYAGTIQAMASSLHISVGTTMEDMDEYMAGEGWRPKLDTLAKIAETNAWVRDRFFAHEEHGIVGLAVFVLREWVIERGLLDEVLAQVRAFNYEIIRSKVLSPEEKTRAASHLRGGTWGTNADGTTDGWGPAAALVVVDRACMRMPPAYAIGFERFRVRKLKETMRGMFDADGLSSMHSTDTTRESWEYIEVCFPDEVDAIRDAAAALMSPSWFATVRHMLKPAYLKHSLKHSLRGFMIRHFLE